MSKTYDNYLRSIQDEACAEAAACDELNEAREAKHMTYNDLIAAVQNCVPNGPSASDQVWVSFDGRTHKVAALHLVTEKLGAGILDDDHPFLGVGVEPAVPFRYETLVEKLLKLTDEQRAMDITVYDFAVDEFYPVTNF